MATRSRIISLVIIFVLIGVGGSLIGVAAGNWVRNHRESTEDRSTRALTMERLNATMKGIGVGTVFPSLPLWSADGKLAVLTDTLLTHGGIVLFVSSECESCHRPLLELQNALRNTGEPLDAGLVIAFGNPEPLRKFVEDNGIRLPVWYDTQNSLVEDYGISAFPTLFALDSQHHIDAIETEARYEETFVSAIQNEQVLE